MEKVLNTNKSDDISMKWIILLFSVMLYSVLNVTCDPLFFRKMTLHIPFIDYYVNMLATAWVYPFLYIILDMIVVISNRKIAVLAVIFGVICDGIFSGVCYFFSTINVPIGVNEKDLMSTIAFNALGHGMWRLWYHGLIATIIAKIAELFIFSYLYRKINSFFISTVTSVVITLVAHNLINDYYMLRNEQYHWSIIFTNLTLNIVTMVIYACIVSMVLKLRIHKLSYN